jgi:peptidoglycan/xylan/chitin deacetylase (PgdA/CDA1 family)
MAYTMNDNNVWYDWPLILAYHSVSNARTDGLSVRVSDFESQMAWLRCRGYRAITLADFTSQSIPKGERIVIITFDDGYADNYWYAFPILKRYGFVATIFLVSEYVNTDHIHWWDLPKKDETDRSHYQILTWDQIHEMLANGIEFGSHTCTHPRLTTCSPEALWDEVSRSRTVLQGKLDQEVISFCYPHGDLNTQAIEMVAEAGYHCAVVTPRRAGIPLTPYTLRRVGTYHSTTLLQFRLK